MALVGYVRVSTAAQEGALQRDALVKAGCSKLFEDKASGAKSDRPGLNDALAYIRAGDVLVVWKLDRLGRSLSHLIDTVTALGGRGVGFKSLTEGVDTSTSNGRLVFHIFGSLAEFERDLIRARTGEGRARAKARGVRDGTQAEDDAASDERGPTPPGGWRADARHRQRLQRLAQHDFEAHIIR